MGGSILRKAAGRSRIVLRLAVSTARSFGKPKIFCIGCNKTGTTSLQRALTELGVAVGEQWIAERLMHDWGRRDFRRLFRYCYTAQAFQDVPFSWPFTFQALDQRFPRSKFILTVRNTPEQWYDSMMSFYAAQFGDHSLTHVEHLKAACYNRRGDVYEANRLLYDTPADDPHNKGALLARYNHHNDAVREYFRHRPEDLLVLNVAETDAYDKLCDFLGKPRTGRSFPWANKTSDHAAAPARPRPADSVTENAL
ncbi:MAG: hypothetical protein MUC65_00805 [Pontiellaceae bacterium]|jgi:hypothetical protein|nr:hypothetical protein [Pontiellaceae bacterium]